MPVELKVDDKRGEFRRETGYGRVTKVEHSDGKRNARVEVDAEHLRQPVAGWVDTFQADAWTAAQRSKADGLRVAYAVDVVRKRNVDAAVAFDQLTKEQKVREVAHLVIVNGDGAPVEPGVEVGWLTNAGRQATESRQAARRDPAETAGEAPDSPAEPRNEPGTANDEPAPPPPPEEPPAGTPPTPSMRGRRGPRIEEAKPWEPFNTDGSVNLGSYAVTASLGMAELAYELIMERNRTEAARTGAALVPPPWGQVKALARRLLSACDRAQAALRSDGRVDRMDNSHTRARGAVRSALDVYPVPWGAEAADVGAWVDTLAAHATELIRIAVALVDPPEEG